MNLGVHISIAKGAERAVGFAVERGCTTVQIFSSNPRGWALSQVAAGEDEALRDGLARHGIAPVLVHAPYLVNIAAPDPGVYTRSVGALVHAAERSSRLGGLVVVHAGHTRGEPREAALDRAAAAILAAVKLIGDARILVEPTAGGTGAVAGRLNELTELLDAVGSERVGACLDTCHAHAAGDDLSTPQGASRWIQQAMTLLGPRFAALHVNDSRDPPGSHRDRHEHLGRGTIGEQGLRAILSDERLQTLPVILETPGRADDDRMNLARARAYATQVIEEDAGSRSKSASRSSKSRRK